MADAVPVSVQRLIQEILSIIANANPRQELNAKKTNTNLVPAIVAIITGAVQVDAEVKKKVISNIPQESLAEAILLIVKKALETNKNIKVTLPENMRKNLGTALNTSNSLKSKIAKLILDIIGNSTKGVLSKETAKKTVNYAGLPPQNANNILRLVLDALKKNLTAEEARKVEEEVARAPKPPANNTVNLIYKLILSLFKNKVPSKGKMPSYGPELEPNFLAPVSIGKNANGKNIFGPPPPGYILTTRNGKVGYYKNKGGFVAPAPPVPPPPPGPPRPRNYSDLDLRGLFNARRKFPENANRINSFIRSKFKDAIRNLKYTSGASLLRRAAELLKILPENYPGRGEIVNLVIDEIRRITRSLNLDSARRNLRNVRNRNIRDELNRKARDLRERRRENEPEYRRREMAYNVRRNNLERRRRSLGSRREGETNIEYERRKAEYERNKEAANREERILRREARMRMQPPPRLPNLGNRGPEMAPPPLPPTQQQAIANAGGVNRAVNAIAAVPGGAPEVAKAAEALNETGGNVAQAVQVKGASPQAVQAVQQLGGVKNTVNVLEGLNTLSQTPETRRRKMTVKRTRRPKKSPIRLIELNRVIDAVKKQKLISLIAHNITRTNNIHPNDEKRKGYYKKVVKSYLLKKPFANIVKKAAKKNM